MKASLWVVLVGAAISSLGILMVLKKRRGTGVSETDERKHSETTLKELERSKALSRQQVEMSARMMRVFGARMYEMDLYAAGAVKRSISVSSAFQSMVKEWNLVTARALVRLQLDTALRFYAAFLVPDPHEFVRQVLADVPVRKMKARDGSLMTDRYLSDRLGDKVPWIPQVYAETSKYIHLSNAQFFATVTEANESGGDQAISLAITYRDEHMPDSSFEEAVRCFNDCTEVFMRYLAGWVETKADPRRADEARNRPDFDPEDV